ncbi:MAG: hypothetical protein OXI79_10570 [Gammaproteobacteria bacterium]|nr:hypothetical protein [Gammaproteobacteria bacterium]
MKRQSKKLATVRRNKDLPIPNIMPEEPAEATFSGSAKPQPEPHAAP